MKAPGPFSSNSRVGFIGLGVMGGGMARCLLRKGWPLTAFDLRTDLIEELGKAGARVAASAQELGAECDLVLLSLPDAAAVEQALFGDSGLAYGLASGSCVVDTSTISATSAREFAERLRERGIWMLDAPVSGGQQGAQDGTLTCMVGGPVEAFEACRVVLSALCKTLVHVGPQGAGQTVKACNQIAVAGAMLGLAEAFALARTQEVDLRVTREVLLGGAARSFALEKHGQRVIDGSFTPGFRAALMRKDLRLALETGRSSRAALPMVELAERLLDELCNDGRADWDWCALALESQRRSGLDIPATKEPR